MEGEKRKKKEKKRKGRRRRDNSMRELGIRRHEFVSGSGTGQSENGQLTRGREEERGRERSLGSPLTLGPIARRGGGSTGREIWGKNPR